ncbi:gamma-glutamylcyclotransferase family protein [Neobacillus sp. CF12]|uniref:gamma-glutamylcyclotransferase n=1 Tax=Neobacillus sp. CF12 TaxID=3055864 RepID=UPI0025A2AF76|nr:gamma-glutamylcyclotransferase family protein [Neobacillus sp. CF12]MDM5327207.1 gamma-glutamylcyclotransferase [Neobacillus sp. CF12]
MERHFVFVYGTLRRHERNHYLLEGGKLVAKQAWTNGKLYDTGLGYPALQESRANVVYGELYLVSDKQLSRLDELEGYSMDGSDNLYDRVKQLIIHDKGETQAYIYTIAEKNQHMLNTPIKSGDWKEYRLRNKDSILYFAYGSCMDDARFKLAKVDHYFQKVTGTGILQGYTLRFSVHMHDGGRADIVEEGGMVEGKVYEIPADCVSYLYRREGVGSRLYRPAFVDLSINGTLYKDVLTFVVVQKGAETAPPEHYAEEILRGGTHFLSETYLEGLKEHINILCKLK